MSGLSKWATAALLFASLARADIPVDSTLAPRNAANFPIVRDTDMGGGFRVVANDTARNAIPSARRVAGMQVYVVADLSTYQLDANLTSWTAVMSGGACPTCVVTTGSYSDPSWITEIATSKLFGNIQNAIAQSYPVSAFSEVGAQVLLHAGDNGGNEWLRINPRDTVTAPWSCLYTVASNAPGPKNDSQVGCGWNLAGSEFHDATQGSMGWNMENYCAEGTGCASYARQMEWYFTFTPPSATGVSGYRGFTMNGNVVTGGLDVAMVGSSACLGSGHDINSASSVCAFAGETDIKSPDGSAALILNNPNLAQFIVGGTQSLFITPTQVQPNVNVYPGAAGTLNVGKFSGPTPIPFKDGAFIGPLGGCGTLGDRPSCTAVYDGASYRTCQTGGTRSSAYLCLGSDAGVFAWSLLKDGGA